MLDRRQTHLSIHLVHVIIQIWVKPMSDWLTRLQYLTTGLQQSHPCEISTVLLWTLHFDRKLQSIHFSIYIEWRFNKKSGFQCTLRVSNIINQHIYISCIYCVYYLKNWCREKHVYFDRKNNVHNTTFQTPLKYNKQRAIYSESVNLINTTFALIVTKTVIDIYT